MKKVKVLIVDDALLARYVIKNHLAKYDIFNVVGEASNGEEAISKFKKLDPDLVTMDLDMPVKGGAEAIEEILKIKTNANIVVISAMEQKYMVEEAENKGAKMFIKKPIDEEDIKKLVDSLKSGYP